jgi:hypothetical protein
MDTPQDGLAEEQSGADDRTSAAGGTGQNDGGAQDGTGQDSGTSPRERLRGWFTGRLPALC